MVNTNRPTGTMTPPHSGVKVRMYRPNGLGDCFLLALRGRDDKARYILIDCGILLGTKKGSLRMRAIAEDLRQATGGFLDVLVVTHEHWDHISGYKYAGKIFDDFNIQQAWFAWTEDPTNPLANSLREKRKFLHIGLESAVNSMTGLAGFDQKRLAGIQSVMEFAGYGLGAAGRSGTAGIMETVLDWAEVPYYLRPGQNPVTLDEVDGVRIFVLGPPEDVTLLGQSEPRKGEVYLSGSTFDEATSFALAALRYSPEVGDIPLDLEDRIRLSYPFDTIDVADFNEEGALKDKVYGKFFTEKYFKGPEYQRIDYDWLGGAESLALKLDNDTNNTSLVLAIELVESGKVLLFPGDAQVGNWLSWHTLSWKLKEEKDKAITASDLLARTVLYKVGHHGSHNATHKEKGLELMTSPNLVAMIPVNKEQAEKKDWEMPYSMLYARLEEKTRGRILLMDDGLPPKPAGVSKREWKRFKNQVEVEDLFIEYTVKE